MVDSYESLVLLFAGGGLAVGICALVQAGNLREKLNALQRQVGGLLERLRLLEKENTALLLTRQEQAKVLPPEEEDEFVLAEDDEAVADQSVAAGRSGPVAPSLVSASVGTVTPAAREKETLAPAAPEPPAEMREPAARTPEARPCLKIGPDTPPPSDEFRLEQIIGQRWLTWAGVLILFLSAGFFLKYAFENGWVGPAAQVGLCSLCGLLLTASGFVLFRRGMSALGQGLQGLGLAILYTTLTAAFAIYEPPVLGQVPAFLLMVGVTALGMTLAVRQNALALALIAVAGGLATPLLVSTGHNSRDILLAYLLMLDFGVFGVALFRRWRVLDTLAQTGTYVLYAGWFVKYYSDDQQGPALAWLGGFYLLFLLLPFVFHYRKRTPVTVERFLLALSNAVYTLAFAWYMLRDDDHYSGGVALGMAAAYVLTAALFRRRVPEDGKTVFACSALAAVYATLAVPCYFSGNGLTLAWAAEVPALFFLGCLFAYPPVRVFALLAGLVAVGRLFWAHWPLPSGDYPPFWNVEFMTAAFIPAMLWLSGLIGNRMRGRPGCDGALDKTLRMLFWIGGGLLLLLLVQQESYHWLKAAYSQQWAVVVSSLIWTAGGLLHLLAARLLRDKSPCLPGGLGLLTALCYAGAALLGGQRAADRLLFLNPEFLTAVAVMVVLFLYARYLGRNAAAAGGFCAGGGLLLFFLLLTYEVYQHTRSVQHLPEAQAQLWVSLSWGAFAALLLGKGFWLRIRWLRFCALGVFGLAALKLLLVDMRESDELLRIVAFVAVGALLLAASFFYHKLEKRLGQESDAERGATSGNAPEQPPKN